MSEELNFAIVSPITGEEMDTLIDRKTSREYINWGTDNKLPVKLWDNYLKCSNLQAIVNTMVEYITGEGIESDYLFEINGEDSFSDLVEKCIFDYIVFGGFAIEGIRNAKGDLVKLNYQNVMNIRVDEDLTTAFLSSAWGSYTGKDIKELPLYTKKEKQPHFIFYYRGNITRNINPVPMYIGALKSIEILNGTRNFHLNNLKNNFSASAIINLNDGNIKTRELKEIKERLEEQHTGTNNAGKFILINGGDRDHAATVERLNQDNFGELYGALSESSKEDLFVAFRINEILLGKNVNTGFSKQEFQEAFELYYATVIKPLQKDIIKVFSKMDIKVDFKKFNINWGE